MDNLNSDCGLNECKPRAVKKDVSLPDCKIYPNTFTGKSFERNKLPYPKIEMIDYFKKKTLAECSNEIMNAINFNKKLENKRLKKIREKQNEKNDE